MYQAIPTCEESTLVLPWSCSKEATIIAVVDSPCHYAAHIAFLLLHGWVMSDFVEIYVVMGTSQWIEEFGELSALGGYVFPAFKNIFYSMAY